MHPTLKMNKHQKFIVLLILLSIILYIFVTAIKIQKYSIIDEKTKADTAIVLGAATTDEAVSAVYRERINHAIRLYENNYVDYIILTGGTGNGNTNSDAYNAKQYAISENIPEEVIFLEEKSKITERNLKYSKDIMDSNSMQTAIIVSDPLHMKRAMLTTADCGITAYSSPTPTSAYVSNKTKIPFLIRETLFYIAYRVYRIFFI